MGFGEGLTGCGCGLSAPKFGISKRLSRSLESLRPRSRSRRREFEGSVNPAADKYTVCQSMNDVAQQRSVRQAPVYPWDDDDGQKENRITRNRGGSFGRGMLQRSSQRRRKVAPEPHSSHQ